MDLYDYMFGDDKDTETDDMLQEDEPFQGLDSFFGLDTPSVKVGGFSTKNAPAPEIDLTPMTAKELGSLALDFTPIIGDIKGGYETVQMIQEELDRENPNYYLIGALGGLGAVGTIVGLVPAVGDAAQKAIMSGARMAAEKSGQLAGEITGTARAVRDGDLAFIRGRGAAAESQGIGADVTRKPVDKALISELDPVRQTSSKGFYKTKAPNYVEDIEVDVEDQGLLIPENPITIDELENTDLIPLIADRTQAGKNLKGVKGGAKDYVFNNPVDLQGGRGFMRYPDTGAFASMDDVMQTQANLAKKIADAGGDPRLVHMSMSPEGGDFSTMMSDTVMEMMDQSDIATKDAKAFDKWVRTNVDADFPGIRDSKAKEFLNTKVTGTRRQKIWKKLDGPEFANKGFPVMGDARVAITVPELLTTPSMQGTSVSKVDTSGRLLGGPMRPHDTYSAQVGPTGAEGYVGELEALPYEIIMRDFFDRRRADGTKAGSDQRSLQMDGSFSQRADAQLIEEANQYLEIQDLAEREAFRRNIPEQRQERKTYSFGDNGGPPLDDPAVDAQMSTAFADDLGIGTSQFNIENPDKVLKNHTLDDLEAIDLSRSTAGGPSKNQKINAPVEEGAEKSIRLNLSSKIDPDGPPAPFNRLQTIHPVNSKGNPVYGTAESYMPAVTVENGTFHVDQKKRRSIAEDGLKVPAMSVQGKFTSQRNVLNEMDDTVVEIGINPKDKHLFTDMKTGQAVKGFDIATIYRDRVYAKGVTFWKKAEAPEPLSAKGENPITNQVRFKMNRGGFVTAPH